MGKRKRQKEEKEEEEKELCQHPKKIKAETSELQRIDPEQNITKMRKKKKKKKKSKETKSQKKKDIEHGDGTEPSGTSQESASISSVIERNRDQSYHWRRRCEMLKELDDFNKNKHDIIIDSDEGEEDDGEDEEEDMYYALHEKFIPISELKKSGLEWKSGKWSKQEYDILIRNAKSFMKKNSIDNFSSYLFSDKPKSNSFFREISRDIRRPVYFVYRKLMRDFDEENYVGKWTKELDDELIRLHSIHGNKWSTIAKALGISNDTCFSRFKTICGKKSNRGEWSLDEEKRLLKVMKEFRGEDWEGKDCELPSTVTWEMIADKVQTRNSSQCRTKWVNALAWRVRGGEVGWDCDNDLKLIKLLAQDADDLEDEESVDWEKLAEGWESARTKYVLRKKWAALKRSIPSSNMMTFQDCLTYLLQKYKDKLCNVDS